MSTDVLTPGTRCVNGNGVYARSLDWHTPVTIVRQTTGYGVTRYVVADRYGRHAYAY